MPKIEGLQELQQFYANSPWLGSFFSPWFNANYNRDRKALFASYINAMVNRVLGMFEWKGLPETIPQETLEKFLIGQGYAIITKVPEEEQHRGGGLYCLPCGLAGELDANLIPTQAVVNSTWLRYSKSGLWIGKDCALIRNDALFVGLQEIFSRYASQLADMEITLRLQAVNNRVGHILKASSDTAKLDAETYLKKLEEGTLGVIGSDEFLDVIDFDTKEYANKSNTSIKDTLESLQWLSAHWFIELGLNDNYNMKREAINSTETDANQDTLLPLIEQMLIWRRKGADELNRLYGLNVSVDYSGSWKRSVENVLNDAKREEAETEILEDQAENGIEEKPEEKPQEGEKEDD